MPRDLEPRRGRARAVARSGTDARVYTQFETGVAFALQIEVKFAIVFSIQVSGVKYMENVGNER